MNKEALAKELKKVIETGKIYLGIKQAKKAIKNEKAKLIVVANNAPENIDSNVPVIKFEGDGFELGALCGKPFSVSVITIISEGEGKLLSMVK